jgi:integrase
MNAPATRNKIIMSKSYRFEKTKHTGLFRRVSTGEYILYTKIKGKIHREGLDTFNEAVALANLRKRMAELEKQVSIQGREGARCMDFGQAVEDYQREQDDRIGISDFTRERNKQRANAIRKWIGFPPETPIEKITQEHVRAWAKPASKRHSSSEYNRMVDILRDIFNISISRGIRLDNPADRIEKVPVKHFIPKMPTINQFWEIVKVIETNGAGTKGNDSANLVRFLAFGGFRQNEAWNILWSDVDEVSGVIEVNRGFKNEGRGAMPRKVPIIPEMKSLLAKLKEERMPGQDRVMKTRDCHKALRAACKKVLGPAVDPLTHHDLRHFFATICIEKGVNVRYLAGWLGHRDGGALLLKTYAHIRQEHSLEAAQLVSFAPKAVSANVVPVDSRQDWTPPQGVSMRYLGTSTPNLKRVTATGEYAVVAKVKIGGSWEVIRRNLGTWNESEAITRMQAMIDEARNGAIDNVVDLSAVAA